MFVVVQDIGTKVQNAWLVINDKLEARNFAERMKLRFPDSTFTVHHDWEVLDNYTPLQRSEEPLLDSRLMEGLAVRVL